MPLNGCSIVVLQVYDNNNQLYAFPVIHDPTHSVKMNWNHCHHIVLVIACAFSALTLLVRRQE